jgi:hypothetical protein
MNTESFQFLRFTTTTFAANVRGDDYTKWREEYGAYLFDCLMEVKPDMAKAVAGTILDPRTNYNETVFSDYIHQFWNHDFNLKGN